MSDEVLSRLDKIDSKLDKISDDIVTSKLTQVKHDMNLQEHLKRSALAEEGIRILAAEIKPLKIRANQMDGILKGLGILATALALITGVLRLIGKL